MSSNKPRLGKTATALLVRVRAGESVRVVHERERGWSCGSRECTAARRLVELGLAVKVDARSGMHSNYNGVHRHWSSITIGAPVVEVRS